MLIIISPIPTRFPNRAGSPEHTLASLLRSGWAGLRDPEHQAARPPPTPPVSLFLFPGPLQFGMRGQRPGGRRSGVQDKTNCRCIHPRKASLRRSPRFWPCRSGWGNGTRWLLVLTLHRPKQSVFLSLAGFVPSCLQNDTRLDQRLRCPIPTGQG